MGRSAHFWETRPSWCTLAGLRRAEVGRGEDLSAPSAANVAATTAASTSQRPWSFRIVRSNETAPIEAPLRRWTSRTTSARFRVASSSVQPWKTVPFTGKGCTGRIPCRPFGSGAADAHVRGGERPGPLGVLAPDRRRHEHVERPIDRHPVDPRKHRLRPGRRRDRKSRHHTKKQSCQPHTSTLANSFHRLRSCRKGFRRRDRPWRARLTTARRKHAVRGRGRTGETGRFPRAFGPGRSRTSARSFEGCRSVR